MDRRAPLALFLLVLAQAAHSVEEYVTKLYEVFAPARFVSGLVSDDLAFGFAVVNTAIVALALWSWAVPVRLGWRSARAWAFFWAWLEIVNGISHLSQAAFRGEYFPGAATAPFLLGLGAWLARRLARAA